MDIQSKILKFARKTPISAVKEAVGKTLGIDTSSLKWTSQTLSISIFTDDSKAIYENPIHHKSAVKIYQQSTNIEAEPVVAETDVKAETVVAKPAIEAVEGPADPTGQSISSMVNQDHEAVIMGMGYSQAVAEKSLYLTENRSVEAAFLWIDDNQGKPDFEEALRIVGHEEERKTEESKEPVQTQALKDEHPPVQEEEMEVPKETIEEIEEDICRLESTLSGIEPHYVDPAHELA